MAYQYFNPNPLKKNVGDCVVRALAMAFDHPKGIYVVATGSHVVAVVNGDYYDSWDSGDEIVAYYFGNSYYMIL